VELVKVQLHHVAFKHDAIGASLLHSLLNQEQFLKGAWHDTWVVRSSLNRVRLTRSGLSIGKNAHIEAIDCTLHEHLSVLEDFLLPCSVAKARIKRVLLFFVSFLTLKKFFFET